MFNILLGGAAGQGVETTSAVIEKILKANGYNVFVTRDLMSRVRGGHNFSTLRFGRNPVIAHDHTVDGILAVNQETIDLHIKDLREDGFIIADDGFITDDARAIMLPMTKTAVELGNPRVASSVAVGALIRLFDLPVEALREILEETLKPEHVEINMEAAKAGYESVTYEQGESSRRKADDTDDKSETSQENAHHDYSDWITLSSSEAIALGALAAGLQFYSAYPMSPSTKIMEYLAGIQYEANIVVEQAEDELAAINAVVGASYAGAVAMVSTSGGGYQLMVEGMASAGMMEIPTVTVIAMRPGPVTGLPTRTEQGDLNLAIFAGNGEYPKMVLAVKNQSDAFYQTARAHHIAQKYQMPVVILTDQYLSDGTATVEPLDLSLIEKVRVSASDEEALAYRDDPANQRGDEKFGEMKESELAANEYKRYRLTEDGISPRLLPGHPKAFVSVDTDSHDEYGFINEAAEARIAQMDKRMRKLVKLIAEDLTDAEQIGTAGSDIVLVAWGSMHGPLKEAVNELAKQGVNVSALVYGDLWPLPTEKIKAEAENAAHIINVEQNFSGQLAGLIRRQTGIAMTDSVLKYDGRPLSASEISGAVLRIVKKG
ncbi:MAG TPA: 2-oxoacid:acceptor oxidoreductase subunit alpha [Clostridiaceae bacterium]|nr:2-oxoacid:acceptor oxidoreductase subunit alpha [Clostridiaceae bacterium]